MIPRCAPTSCARSAVNPLAALSQADHFSRNLCPTRRNADLPASSLDHRLQGLASECLHVHVANMPRATWKVGSTMAVDATMRPVSVLSVSDRRTLSDLESASEPVDVVLDQAVRERVASGREFVMRCLAERRAVYGATTGFGPLVGFVGRDTDSEQCENLLSHLTAGQGPDLPVPIVRAAVLARLSSLAMGRSGVSASVLDALAAMLRTTFTPAVPRLGSVGASGDLIPLAHVTQALKGRGHAYADGVRMPASVALSRCGLRPLELDGRDALGLVNGVSLTTAAAGLAMAQFIRSHRSAGLLTAVLVDQLGSGVDFSEHLLLDAFGHPDVVEEAEFLRSALAGTVPTGNRPLQEPYTIRCAPQLLGAVRASVRHANQVILADLNGISDNPLFFAEHDKVLHGGNFFGQPVAFAADIMTLAAVQTGNLAERQLDLLVDPHRNGGLPPVLATEPGRQHGVQGVQIAATAIVADMRRTATPASIQSLPTNLHNQDVVPFGTQAAFNAFDHVQSLRLLHGSLALALRQAVHVGARKPTAPVCAEVIERLADEIAPIDPDRPLHDDVRAAADVLDAIAAEA
ncbi:aromatic amino acid ammonia-lyase [Lentzea sp. NPDC004782]|uniref:aromatic amino acid ammonia-lyase n=1 Tax=Lentzea sp. NPDC004782 TaxID=3154458 RepID=UPI0033A2B834